VNPDLLAERAKCTFDQKELFRFMTAQYDFYQEMNQLVKDHPELLEG